MQESHFGQQIIFDHAAGRTSPTTAASGGCVTTAASATSSRWRPATGARSPRAASRCSSCSRPGRRGLYRRGPPSPHRDAHRRVPRTVTAEEHTAGHRLYGLVEGDLLWAYDKAALGQPLSRTHRPASRRCRWRTPSAFRAGPRRDRLADELRERGYRLTPQRQLVLEAVAGSATRRLRSAHRGPAHGERRQRLHRLPDARAARGARPGHAHPPRARGADLPPRARGRPPAPGLPRLRRRDRGRDGDRRRARTPDRAGARVRDRRQPLRDLRPVQGLRRTRRIGGITWPPPTVVPPVPPVEIGPSPLLALPGAVEAEPPDAGIAWHYGDPLGEQRRLERGEGLVDLSNRGVVQLTGPIG